MKTNTTKTLTMGMAAMAAMAWSAQAALYLEDFELNPGYSGTQDFAVGAAGSAAAGGYVGFDVWAGTTDIGITQALGVLNVSSNTSGGSGRGRGFAVTIDTSGATTGTYTVSFDITNFVANSGSVGMAVHEGSGFDTQYAQWDTGGNNASSSWPRNQGTSTSAIIGSTGGIDSGITANGTYSFDVDLTEAGVSGDWIALAFGQTRIDGATLAPTYTLDNVSIAAVPEPSSAVLLGLGGLALIFRRRK